MARFFNTVRTIPEQMSNERLTPANDRAVFADNVRHWNKGYDGK